MFLKELAVATIEKKSYSIIMADIFSMNLSISGREYGGFNHTRPNHCLERPSSFLLYITAAVFHRGVRGAHGSKSNGPNAWSISFGVYHSSVLFCVRSKVVFILLSIYRVTITNTTLHFQRTPVWEILCAHYWYFTAFHFLYVFVVHWHSTFKTWVHAKFHSAEFFGLIVYCFLGCCVVRAIQTARYLDFSGFDVVHSFISNSLPVNKYQMFCNVCRCSVLGNSKLLP